MQLALITRKKNKSKKGCIHFRFQLQILEGETFKKLYYSQGEISGYIGHNFKK